MWGELRVFYSRWGSTWTDDLSCAQHHSYPERATSSFWPWTQSWFSRGRQTWVMSFSLYLLFPGSLLVFTNDHDLTCYAFIIILYNQWKTKGTTGSYLSLWEQLGLSGSHWKLQPHVNKELWVLPEMQLLLFQITALNSDMLAFTQMTVWLETRVTSSPRKLLISGFLVLKNGPCFSQSSL